MTFLEKIQAAQKPAFILIDTDFAQHQGDKYVHDKAIYYYTPEKGRGRVHFEKITKDQKCVSLRKNTDDTITAITFTYIGSTFAGHYIKDDTQFSTVEVLGNMLSSEHYETRAAAKAAYPEAFESVKDKFKTGVCILPL
ncbi:hypothetical protein L4C37_02385 [Vibrio kagoshimensis]|uniref:hypothetical protein n=1 Tax=Vibrio kagoshimensis TaxID=2910244 RepID=UPI003D1BE6E7